MAAVTRLGLSGGPVPVVLGGGLLRVEHPRLTPRIDALVAATVPAADVCTPAVAPVVGAGLMAADLAGLPDVARSRIRAELSTATAHRRPA